MEFEKIYREYKPRIYRLCYGFVNDREVAEDLCQETFLTVWQQQSKFRGESSPGTWIFRIASNICLRHVERAGRMKKEELPFQLEEPPAEDRSAQVETLYKCISQLEETDRLIISLVLEDLPQKEIAAIAGLSDGNLRVKIHRIKQELTKKFNAYERV